MKLTIKSIDSHGRSDKRTTQTEWHVSGDIDGTAVEFSYLDAGNNAEYDLEVDFSMTKGKGKGYEGVLLRWIAEDESRLVDLKAGGSVDLRNADPKPPQHPGFRR